MTVSKASAIFLCPVPRGPPGNLRIESFVRPFVSSSIRFSVILSHLQSAIIKFGWSYSNQTWTVSSF